jgi:V/A-type H+-transporting ATPase subunit E
MMSEKQPGIASSGVEELIERLHTEGVAAGQQKAEDIVSNAQKRAEWIIEEAELEAKQVLDTAKAKINMLQAAGDDALEIAARDVLLKLRDTLLNSFSEEVARTVNQQMTDKDFLQKLILALATTSQQQLQLDTQNLVLQLSADAIGLEDLRNNPEQLEQGSLSHFAASIAASLLKQGVRIEVNEAITAGIIIKLEGNAMVIDFTDESVAGLLLEHLQPRFRALLQGIIK